MGCMLRVGSCSRKWPLTLPNADDLGVRGIADQIRFFSMAPFIYSAKGKDMAAKVWSETMAELDFAGVGDIIRELSN